MAIENITVGTMAIARVGRNAIEVEIIALEDGGAYRVRNRNGKEFTARRLEPIPENCHERGNFSKTEISASAEPAQQIIIPPTASNKPEITETPEKHLSLMEAAIRVLQSQPDGSAFNTRELVAMATEQGLWTPTGARTPEQTLYCAIFREIATKEQPRIVKAEQKGKFRLA